MTNQVEITKEVHGKLAVDIFNFIWSLIDKEERTDEDNHKMINAAHASLFHWRQVGTPLHFQRGEWMLARVYCLQKMPESALFHANNCLSLTEEYSIGDFDRAFAYEAMARASACAGHKDDCTAYYQKAEEAGADIEKKEDKDYFFSDLKGGNWFGMK